MKWLRAHYQLMGGVALAGLCLAGVLCGPIEENMLALVPKQIRRSVQLFERSPLSQKLLVLVQAPTAVQAGQVAQDLREKLVQEGKIQAPASPADREVQPLLNALPARFSPRVQQQVAQKLTPQAIDQQLTAYYQQLFSLQGMLTAQLMAQDPFYLTEVLIKPWAAFGQQVHQTYENGFLTARGGTLQAGLFDTSATVSDLRAAQQLQQFFDRYQAALAQGVRVFFMGGLRYTLENASLIKRDLLFISWAGLAGLSGVFIWLLRTKRALLIYALPFLVLPPAAWLTQLVFGRLSGLTLGFGSVVAGLSVDYAVYTYFALQQTQQGVAQTLSQIRKHVGCNFVTSALCFAALFFSSVEVFKQIAVFALAALSLAWAISLRVFPAYFSRRTARPVPLPACPGRALSRRAAGWVTAGLLVWGVWGVTHVTWSEGLDALNSTSAVFAQDKQAADELFAPGSHALLFALGATPNEALAQNEALAARLPDLPLQEMFVSGATQAENKARWHAFWSEARRHEAQRVLQTQARQKGIQPQAFEPFWQWLQQENFRPETDFYTWYNPLLQLNPDLYAVVNVVPNDPLYARAANGINAVFVSADQLQQELGRAVRKEALRVVLLALGLNVVAVWSILRTWKDTLVCFIPVVLGGCILFGCLALARVHVNLFGLIFLPLLIGLGIDYAIFQVLKQRSAPQGGQTLYPVQALWVAGLSTLVGFGVLVLAKHAVLFMMGLCALLGIGGAIFAAVWILPACLEKKA